MIRLFRNISKGQIYHLDDLDDLDHDLDDLNHDLDDLDYLDCDLSDLSVQMI